MYLMLLHLRSLLGRTYYHLNTVEISALRLRDNYTYLSSLEAGLSIAPVLKSNAYGHGLVEVARILDSLHPPFFCVDSLFEAYTLKKAGIRTPILIMGYVHPESLRVKKLPFSFAVFTTETLVAVKKYQPHAPIHIFVDTGMHREGVPFEELAQFIELAKNYGLRIEGLMTHLGMADEPSNTHTRDQIDQFTQARQVITDHHVSLRWIHAGASLAILHTKAFGPALGNVGRAGISLYGIDPEGRNHTLLPVLGLYSTIVQIKELRKRESVGYDFTFTAKHAMKIALLPIGYHDGVDRRLSNKGSVLVRSVPCPIIGKVSMNMTVIDVSRVSGVQVHDRVTVYSPEPARQNSILQVSKTCRTLPYELLVHLTPFTKRVVLSDDA